MAWWRRDPSLWARSPAHRYAQRVLRDHEATLRTRCFSRSPSNTAQHQDHDSEGRADGMTDQEWLQLQRYRRWKKMLQDHPYKGLFGASEDMLRGKGLTDWEWVYKTFPKWMLQEMDPQEPVKKDNYMNRKDSGRKYGDRSEAKSQTSEQPLAERKSCFAQPVIRTTHYERDEFGIVSPSDLRRPADAAHVKVVGKHVKGDVTPLDVQKAQAKGHNAKSPPVDADKTASSSVSGQPLLEPIDADTTATTAKEAAARESSFIDAFFANEPKAYDRDLGDSKSWRQTAVQRRSAPNVIARSRTESSSIASTDTAATTSFTIPSSQALVDNYPYPQSPSTTNTTATENKLRPVGGQLSSAKAIQDDDLRKADSPSTLTTSEKLQHLPEDDIDFLSADEIRAAMGRRTNIVKTSQEKEQDRKTLETGYATTKVKALDAAVEGHVLNNYHVRRTEQMLGKAQTAAQAHEMDGAEAEQNSSESQPTSAQMESSIDRMRRWIEEGGTSLAKHFWQDPIEAGAPSEADMQFAKQMSGLAKGRHAREHISDDLEADLPMCKGLLERLKSDETRVEHAVFLLRSPRRVAHGTEISKNLRAIRERRLRNTYERTEKQFESACQSLRDLEAETIQKATNAFKRRLGIASRILHKNHTLTRMLTWSAQARLDEPDLERSKAELYSEILTRLATLRDTQLALARLMDHAIQTYRVSLKPADEALSSPVLTSVCEPGEAIIGEHAIASNTAGSKFLADAAAAAQLSDEIQSQKTAMQGLSDDGYARAPKQIPRRPFEEKNPLAHSLFRPFNLQFESLGKKSDAEEAAVKVEEALKQKAADRKLVQEVRSAYEDVYGPITVEHRQIPHTEEPASAEATDSKSFEMLKEDPLNVEATAVKEEACAAVTVADCEATKTEPVSDEVEPEAVNNVLLSRGSSHEEPVATALASANTASEASQDTSSRGEASTTADFPSIGTTGNATSTTDLPTHYTILVHDPQTDTLNITTSTSGPPRDTSPALPIHQALSTLKAPARFIPHITSGLEVVTAKRHMLVLRDALDETSSTRGFETIGARPSADKVTETFSNQVNPIDGTSRLSPTGYSGVEQSREQLERDFEERRQAAAATEAARSKKFRQHLQGEEVPKKRRGGVGGVVKTAIWAGAVCYIVGVTAELLR